MKYIKSFNESNKSNKPNIKKLDIDGFLVFMGRDALSNDYLTFEVADNEDYWMHAKGVPGSHVVIRVDSKIPGLETIKKAAKLAAKNSKSSDDQVNVVYCKRKFVKKEPGMNVGQVKVDYTNSYEITVSKN
jgi:predicted ribosome quality control (RQC) complex YloA/Tae2 family protein